MIDPQTLEWLLIALAGVLGGLLHEVLRHNGTIILPKRVNGEVHLGTLTSALVGLVVALIVDRTPVTAFFVAFGVPNLMRILDRWEERKRNESKNNLTPNNQKRNALN